MRFDLLPLVSVSVLSFALARFHNLVVNDEDFCRAEFTLLFIFRFVFDSRELIVFFPDPKILGKPNFSTNFTPQIGGKNRKSKCKSGDRKERPLRFFLEF